MAFWGTGLFVAGCGRNGDCLLDCGDPAPFVSAVAFGIVSPKVSKPELGRPTIIGMLPAAVALFGDFDEAEGNDRPLRRFDFFSRDPRGNEILIGDDQLTIFGGAVLVVLLFEPIEHPPLRHVQHLPSRRSFHLDKVGVERATNLTCAAGALSVADGRRLLRLLEFAGHARRPPYIPAPARRACPHMAAPAAWCVRRHSAAPPRSPA